MAAPHTSEPETALHILGADPWMRFDLWANRAWEAAGRAADLAMVNGAPVNPDDDLDHRVVTLFHSAAVAKEFAEMTNPLLAVSDVVSSAGPRAAQRADISLDMIMDTEEQGQ